MATQQKIKKQIDLNKPVRSSNRSKNARSKKSETSLDRSINQRSRVSSIDKLGKVTGDRFNNTRGSHQPTSASGKQSGGILTSSRAVIVPRTSRRTLKNPEDIISDTSKTNSEHYCPQSMTLYQRNSRTSLGSKMMTKTMSVHERTKREISRPQKPQTSAAKRGTQNNRRANLEHFGSELSRTRSKKNNNSTSVKQQTQQRNLIIGKQGGQQVSSLLTASTSLLNKPDAVEQ